LRQINAVKTLLNLFLPITGTLVAIAGTGLYLFQDKLIYFPRPYLSGDIESFVARGGIVLPFRTASGEQTAFFVPPPGPKLTQVWCCFAGNGGQALGWEGFARAHAAAGRAFLLIEWPGYGASQGKPRNATIRDSAAGAVAALASHLGLSQANLSPRLAALGHSLGAAGALAAADELGLRRVILFSPFTSMAEMAVRQMGPVIGRLLRNNYDNRAALDSVISRPGASVTIFHGTADELIPIEMARELHERHPAQVHLIELPGADHNGLFGPAEADLERELSLTW
jgi:pimeloyl-ACP methyl ester carboxylesterase